MRRGRAGRCRPATARTAATRPDGEAAAPDRAAPVPAEWTVPATATVAGSGRGAVAVSPMAIAVAAWVIPRAWLEEVGVVIGPGRGRHGGLWLVGLAAGQHQRQ